MNSQFEYSCANSHRDASRVRILHWTDDRSPLAPIAGTIGYSALNAMQANGIGRGSAEMLLIERVLGGEKEVFHELIRPYERGAFVIAYSILRNQDDAEEAVQQGMLKILTHLAELAERDLFRQWAMRIVEEKSFRPRQFADWRDLPSDIVEQKEVQHAVAKALGALPRFTVKSLCFEICSTWMSRRRRKSWDSASPR